MSKKEERVGDGSSCPNQKDQPQSTMEATVQSHAVQCPESKKPLHFADELTEKGKKALRDCDFSEAVDFFSRALEIRVSHHGELSPLCVDSYYKYGCALLYKAQEEADPLGSMPKKDVESQHASAMDGGDFKDVANGESSTALASSTVHQETNPNQQQGGEDNGENEEEDGNEASDAEDVDDADESDLDLAWKMLDVARAIAEKNPDDTMEKVEILSLLAEVALEREDIQTSLDDYLKALSMLERLVEPDSRHIAELNFRICLCLEIGCKVQEAIPFCEKAISVCKSKMQRLMVEANASPASMTSDVSASDNSAASDKQKEIETLHSLSGDLEKKLEDLQQSVTNPSSILSDILGLVSAKGGADKDGPSAGVSSSGIGTANSAGDFDSPTVSTAHTNGTTTPVTHLGVVGRGVKRVGSSSASVESSSVAKKQAVDPEPPSQGDRSGA